MCCFPRLPLIPWPRLPGIDTPRRCGSGLGGSGAFGSIDRRPTGPAATEGPVGGGRREGGAAAGAPPTPAHPTPLGGPPGRVDGGSEPHRTSDVACVLLTTPRLTEAPRARLLAPFPPPYRVESCNRKPTHVAYCLRGRPWAVHPCPRMAGGGLGR